VTAARADAPAAQSVAALEFELSSDMRPRVAVSQ